MPYKWFGSWALARSHPFTCRGCMQSDLVRTPRNPVCVDQASSMYLHDGLPIAACLMYHVCDQEAGKLSQLGARGRVLMADGLRDNPTAASCVVCWSVSLVWAIKSACDLCFRKCINSWVLSDRMNRTSFPLHRSSQPITNNTNTFTTFHDFSVSTSVNMSPW
ncbi:hypothetical protein LIA77_08952 [Sarocladium implicatum]|nr:hypothetical protein LIA77_08952 [Sarocladium implicatum]